MSKMTFSEAGKLGAEKTHRLWQERYKNKPKLCKHCQSILPYEKRHNQFCGHPCAASHNNRNKVKRKIPQIQHCENCNKEIFDNKCLRKFCSHKCFGQYQWEQTKIKIKSGETVRHPQLRKYLFETRGIQCEICERKEWEGHPIPLVMDHIDGNHENNDLTNLRLVCGNCDMLLPTYKGKNIGNGREYRRQWYAEGRRY